MNEIVQMKKKHYLNFSFFFILQLSNSLFAFFPTQVIDPTFKAKTEHLPLAYKHLGFQENKGQFADVKGNLAPYVLFKASAPNLNIWITNTGITYQFLKIEEKKTNKKHGSFSMRETELESQWHRVDMILKNAVIKKENAITEGEISTIQTNYFLGHCPNGVMDVKTHTKIIIKNIYEGIDWIIYTTNGINGSSLKQDFIVHPNANTNQIKLIYEGSGEFTASKNQLSFKNQLGEIEEGQLLCYQGNESNVVPSNYMIIKNTSLSNLGAGNTARVNNGSGSTLSTEKTFSYEISIQTANYTKNETLIIDPQLIWSTFYGSAGGEEIKAMDRDPVTGDLYAVGAAGYSGFPLVIVSGAYNQFFPGDIKDAFILKYNASGVPLWCTFLGGINEDQAYAVCVDQSSNIIVVGKTRSYDFPAVTPGGGAYYQSINNAYSQDAFISKFNSNGALFWSTSYGGSVEETAYGVCTDQSGNIFVTGATNSSNFPRLNPGGGAYMQTMVNANASVFEDAFILKFNSVGVRLWATFYGGNNFDFAYAIACDAAGNVFITGEALSFGNTGPFPVFDPAGGAFYNAALNGGSDAFVVKFNNNGVRQWATLLGGDNIDKGLSIKCDALSNIIITGITGSLTGFPTLNPGGAAYCKNTNNNPTGSLDAFILKFNNNGVQTWGTYYGGSGNEDFATNDNIEIVDGCNSIIITFNTESTNVPTINNNCAVGYLKTANSGANDVFIAKFNSSGVHLWGGYFGGNGEDRGEALAVDLSNDVYIAGAWGLLAGGPNINNSTYPLINPGGGAYYNDTFNGGTNDAYIAKFKNVELNPTFIPASVNSTICASCNGSATITINCGDAPFNYTWSNGTQALNSTSNTNTITGLCPGTYTVTAISGCNKALTATYTITGTYGITPTVTTNGTLTINCTNTTGNISANAIPISSTYSWTGPGIVSGANTSSPLVNAGGTYIVTANYFGCTKTATVTVINNNTPPNLTTTGSSFEINCLYASDTITALSTTSGVTYNWSGPVIVSGGTTPTPTVNAPGTYTVVTTNPTNGCTSSAVVNVTQNTTTPNLSAGASLMLTCTITSSNISASSNTTGVIYNWNGPGIVSGNTTSTSTVSQPGTYTVTVTNPVNGCTETTTLVVDQNIVIPDVSVGSGFMLTCAHTSGTISANSITSGVTYQWTGPNIISGNTNKNATVNAQGTYTITVTNPANGCTATKTVIITSDNSIPDLTAGTPLTLNCLILDGTINASSLTPDAAYSWSGPGIVSGENTSMPTVNKPGSYIVTITDPLTGCTAVGSVLVINDNAPPAITATTAATITCVTIIDTITVTSLTPGATYNWSGTIVSGSTSDSAVINAPGTYTVTVTNPTNGCTNTAAVIVNLNITSPNAVAGNPITLTCAATNKPITVSSTTPGANYIWSGPGIVSGSTTSSPIVNRAGIYTVILTDPVNGCTRSASVTANQNTVPPNVTAGAALTLTCSSTSNSISASSTTLGTTFSWSGPHIISGANTSTLIVDSIGTYTVSAIDPINGCISKDSVLVNSNLIPPNVASGPDLTLHCNLTSSTITASSTTLNAAYSWAGPGTITNGNTISPTVNTQGNYTVTVTNPINGCTKTSTVAVVVQPLPSAYINAGVTIILGNSTTLYAGGGGNYSWFPTIGLSCSTCQNPVAAPADTITYCVTVTDQYGCSDSACVRINVVDPCPPSDKDFPIPNVFSPNGDNENDLFYLKDWNNECIIEFSIEIYDRWGLKLFESNGNDIFWDGRTPSGIETSAGTYYYLVKVRKTRNEVKVYKGFIMLTR